MITAMPCSWAAFTNLLSADGAEEPGKVAVYH